MIGKKGQFIVLVCIGLMISVAIAPLNIQMVTAVKNNKNPIFSTNITELQYCDTCHENEMPDTFITVTVDSQTTDEITYFVTGSNTYDGEEGWAVFDNLENNVENGFNSGFFTLPKNGRDYRVYWVDNGTGGVGEAGGGSAYEDITTPNDPPSDPTLTGTKEGKAGESYTYKVKSDDPQNDNIFYFIDWDDGSDTGWFGPFPSGEEQSKSHSWTEQDEYTIKAKARDEHGAESGWTELKVTMPKNKALYFNFNIFNWLFQHFPNLIPILKYLI
jgi:hypothetical protein